MSSDHRNVLIDCPLLLHLCLYISEGIWFLLQLVSDSVARHDVYYTISGPGYDQNPVGVFKLDSLSGMLSVLKSVDREQFPMFVVSVTFSLFVNLIQHL